MIKNKRINKIAGVLLIFVKFSLFYNLQNILKRFYIEDVYTCFN